MHPYAAVMTARVARVARTTFRMAYSPYLDRAAIRSAERAVDQMADDFRVIIAAKGGVDADDLELLGWTAPQIEQHGKSARQRAMALSAAR